MCTGQNRRGFSLSELLAVMGIIAVLSALLYPVFAAARDSTRVVTCASNLQQIGVAASMYHADNDGPPMSRLTNSLADYVGSPDVFVCPDDPIGQDSYSAYFVGRNNPALSSEYIVGCPRHNHGHKQAVVLGKGHSSVGLTGTVTHDGKEIVVGESVEGGTLHFADESQLDISDGLTVYVLASVNGKTGLHTVVWVPEGQEGWLDASVTPGSRFEIVTPESVAAVRGTRFHVYVYTSGSCCRDKRTASYITVLEGTVVVRSRTGPGQAVLKPGRSIEVRSYLSVDETRSGADDADDCGPGPWPRTDNTIGS